MDETVLKLDQKCMFPTCYRSCGGGQRAGPPPAWTCQQAEQHLGTVITRLQGKPCSENIASIQIMSKCRRAFKSCRRADARLHKKFKNLRKIWNFERKRGIKRHFFYDFGKFLQIFLKFYMFSRYFKPMPLRKIFSQEVMPAQKN